MAFGLRLAAAAALLVAVASSVVGYPAEVAILRGLVAWGGVGFVAFLAEMVVATTPPPASTRLAGNVSPLHRAETDDEDETEAA